VSFTRHYQNNKIKEMRRAGHEIDDCIQNIKGRDYLRDLGVDGRIILKLSLHKHDVPMLTGLIWLRTDPRGGLLWTRNDNLGAIS
jgi:hypothetical protein